MGTPFKPNADTKVPLALKCLISAVYVVIHWLSMVSKYS